MKKGFTLIELIAVIVILAATITLVVSKVENTISNTNEIEDKSQIEMIESSALIYMNDENLENDVETLTIDNLITAGLIKQTSVENIDKNNLILVTKINGTLKAKYLASTTIKPAIFLVGSEDVSVKINKTYTDAGAYVAVYNSGISKLTGVSTVNTSVVGDYTVTYTYTNADTVVRNVSVIN